MRFIKHNKVDRIGDHADRHDGVIVDGNVFTFDYLVGCSQCLVGAYCYRLDLQYEFHPNNDYQFVVQFLHDEIRRLKE